MRFKFSDGFMFYCSCDSCLSEHGCATKLSLRPSVRPIFATLRQTGRTSALSGKLIVHEAAAVGDRDASTTSDQS